MMHCPIWARACSSARTPGVPALISLRDARLFQESLSANSTLATFKDAYQTGKFRVVEDEDKASAGLNSNRSLPMLQFPKYRIFEEVAKDAKIGEWRKPVTKWARLAKAVLKMYMVGLKNNWYIRKSAKKVTTKFGTTPEQFAAELYKDMTFQEIEHRIKGLRPAPLRINRSEFQELHRQKEFWKIPAFFALYVVFEEFLPLICYLLPSIVPWNCLTPGGFKKLSDLRVSSKSLLPFKSQDKLVPAYASPYSVPLDNVIGLLRSHRMISRWKAAVYRVSGNRTQLCELLTQLSQNLTLDDWFLVSQVVNADGIVAITDRELVNAVLERQLYFKGEDLNALASTEIGRRLLVWRLLIYWSFRFHGTTVTGGPKTFSETWGVNNVGIMNFPGSTQLLDFNTLKNVVDQCCT
ncbi:Pnt1p [Lachancea thermotolerans CBS 6340]|uniref:KLTH0D12144p n=1 Tax=Lachancea thermotolerans (strain ATCC 56472 / CBS 6340 / NRRL Y-8284) TaxID=559295 RepID=C5DF46_LACTC|nr:KLTH0D12144p [Lachancea thermotolerans CBS 6340]CAR22801.1 KLTH0D12144p [Lachancea thermotolerans CBS 6340]